MKRFMYIILMLTLSLICSAQDATVQNDKNKIEDSGDSGDSIFEQEVENFDDSVRVSNSWELSQGDVIAQVTELNSQGNLLLMRNGDYIVSPRAVIRSIGKQRIGIGQIIFHYYLPLKGDDYEFVVEYKKSDPNELWQTVEKKKCRQENEVAYTIKVSKLDITQYEVESVRISVSGKTAHPFIIADISIRYLNNNQIEQLESIAEFDKYKKKYETIKMQEDDSSKLKGLNRDNEDLKSKYVDAFGDLSNLVDKIGFMRTTATIFVFMYDYADITNPLKYDEFKKIIQNMEAYADEIEMYDIKKIQTSFEEKNKIIQESVNEIKEKKEGRGKNLLSVVYNAANIMTRGSLGGIISTVKNIFSGIFKKSNIRDKLTDVGEAIKDARGELIKDKTDKQIFVRVAKGEINQKLNKILEDANKDYKKLDAFFNLIEESELWMTGFLEKLKEIEARQQLLQEKLETFIIENYLKTASIYDPTKGINDYMLNKSITIDSIRRYISEMKSTHVKDLNDILEKYKNLSENLSAVRGYIIEYNANRKEFLGAFYKLKADINASKNPFKEHKDLLSGSYEVYDQKIIKLKAYFEGDNSIIALIERSTSIPE